MKSKIAESYIDSKVEEVDDVIKFGAPKLVVRLHNAIRAVELAEQETSSKPSCSILLAVSSTLAAISFALGEYLMTTVLYIEFTSYPWNMSETLQIPLKSAH